MISNLMQKTWQRTLNADAKTFSTKSGCVTHTTSYGFLASCQNLEKINDPIPKKAPKQMEEWKDGQILFYRTPQAIVGGPTKSQDAN